MVNPMNFIGPLAVFWFLIFWLVGGVLFSIIALFRSSKIKKTQFSCLFTLLCAGCAYGAAHTGMMMGAEEINVCLEKAVGWTESFSAIIACGVFAMMISGLAWFILLFVGGSLLLLLSRSKNQSWIDGKVEEDEMKDKTQKLIIE